MIAVLCVFAILTLLTLAICVFVYFRTYRRTYEDVTYKVLSGPDYDEYAERSLEVIRAAAEIPFEEVRAKSYDGLELYGRLYVQDPSRPFHLQFNGYRGNGLRDFAGGLQIDLDSGDNVLNVDQRSHGRSEGKVISFGVKERFDVQTWVAYVAERFGPETVVFLEGISMGAATVLMASDLPFACPVAGIVADCPYSSPFGIIRKVGRDAIRMGDAIVPFVCMSARLFGGFSLFDSSALKSVPNASAPILLIHGTGDHFVPFEMSAEIHALRPDLIRFVPVEGAPHGLSYFKDTPKYLEETRSFRADCLERLKRRETEKGPETKK